MGGIVNEKDAWLFFNQAMAQMATKALETDSGVQQAVLQAIRTRVVEKVETMPSYEFDKLLDVSSILKECVQEAKEALRVGFREAIMKRIASSAAEVDANLKTLINNELWRATEDFRKVMVERVAAVFAANLPAEDSK